MFARIALLLALAAGFLAGCTNSDEPQPPATVVASAPALSIPASRWRAVLVAGDNSSPAFDNGIDTLRERIAGMGVRAITVYSASPGRGQLFLVLDHLQHRRDDPAATRAADDEPRAAVAHDDGRRHGTQHALAGSDGVRRAAEQAEHVR